MENQQKLEHSLKQELYLLRELLTNLMQEEMALLQKNTKWLYSLNHRKLTTIESLEKARKARLIATEEELPYKRIEESFDLPILLEQISSLAYKIQKQNSLNQVLTNSQRLIKASAPSFSRNALLTLPEKEAV